MPEGGYGLPADIWSVGCTVLEMVGGELPFCGMDMGAIMFKVGMYKTHANIPDEISEDCIKFLERCLDPNPVSRASESDLAEDL